ncbi:MAG: energy transducer TonB [Spirochaetaceae bacterium]|jgi:protein TonB|nr:energy transducer TonB [Spirochaetaceae bacterium]
MLKDDKNTKDRLRRGGVLLFVALLHVILLFFIVFSVEVTAGTSDLPPAVMKLADINEEEPPQPPSPEPKKPPAPAAELAASDDVVAENVIEAEETPVEVAAAAPSSALSRYAEEYLPQNMVSTVPKLDEKEIRSRLIYPPIALRAGLEGMVYLELYIDSEGLVRRVRVLKENPHGRGFGEAAVKAFEGLRGRPALANGEAVAVRYRYPVRFQVAR